MKKKMNIKSVIIISALCMTAASCHKESVFGVSDMGQSVEQPSETRYIQYTVNGATHYMIITGEEEWQSFLTWIMQMAREGNSVSLRDECSSSFQQGTKETVTFTTTNEGEAKAWCEQMLLQGYEITIEYNESTGTYFCKATR